MNSQKTKTSINIGVIGNAMTGNGVRRGAPLAGAEPLLSKRPASGRS
jgi:hypothetical protein